MTDKKDDYAHPVGAASSELMKGAVDLWKQADAAQAAGDKATADRLNDEAAQHIRTANQLDRADEAYKDRNSG